MIYKSVSIKNVIGRIIRNTRLQDSSFIQDMGEWIPEAMGYMRTKVTLSPQWKDITIDYYKGKLPCDLRTLNAVAYKGTRMRYFAGIKSFGTRPDCTNEVTFISQPTSTVNAETITTKIFQLDTIGASDVESWTIQSVTVNGNAVSVNLIIRETHFTDDIVTLNTTLNALGIGEFTCTWDIQSLTIKVVEDSVNIITAITYLNPALSSANMPLISSAGTSTPGYEENSLDSILSVQQCSCLPYGAYTYYTEMDYINTSLCDGTVRIFYKAIPTDEDGFPTVPDNEDYKEAIYWYVRMKMIGCGYVDSVFKYTDCEERFWMHATKAIGQIRYPSVDQVETWTEISTRLILPTDYFETFFTNPGKEGMIDM